MTSILYSSSKIIMIEHEDHIIIIDAHYGKHHFIHKNNKEYDEIKKRAIILSHESVIFEIDLARKVSH